jgi:BlaI family transcriptional regulator, penicillinase repressor
VARTPQDVTDAELAVLEILWSEGPAAIRRLTEVLYPQGGNSNYATVQKLLERLEGKKYVEHSRSVTPHVFSAVIAREELIGQRLQATAEKLCGGSLTPLLMHLVKANSLSADQRRELRSLIDDLDQKNHSTRGKRGPAHE